MYAIRSYYGRRSYRRAAILLKAATLVLVGAFGSDHQDGTHDIDFGARNNFV